MARNGRKGLPRRGKKQENNDQLWPEMVANHKKRDLPVIAILGVLAICFEKVMFLLGNMGGCASGGINNNLYKDTITYNNNNHFILGPFRFTQ